MTGIVLSPQGRLVVMEALVAHSRLLTPEDRDFREWLEHRYVPMGGGASFLTDQGKAIALNALATEYDFVGLHTGLPSSAGSNEVTGGSPAYARKSHTWNAASAGSIDDSNQPVFDVPASTTVAYVGLWNQVSGGGAPEFGGAFDVTDEVFASQGTYTLTDADISL